jgi:hypothetical protein
MMNKLLDDIEISFRNQKNIKKINIMLKSGRNLAIARSIPGTLVSVVTNMKAEYTTKYFLKI